MTNDQAGRRSHLEARLHENGEDVGEDDVSSHEDGTVQNSNGIHLTGAASEAHHVRFPYGPYTTIAAFSISTPRYNQLRISHGKRAYLFSPTPSASIPPVLARSLAPTAASALAASRRLFRNPLSARAASVSIRATLLFLGLDLSRPLVVGFSPLAAREVLASVAVWERRGGAGR
jgi:hypothetical protein